MDKQLHMVLGSNDRIPKVMPSVTPVIEAE
jgi:hypothetical protein